MKYSIVVIYINNSTYVKKGVHCTNKNPWIFKHEVHK